MKKIAILILLIITLFTVSHTTYGTTTLFLGKSIGGNNKNDSGSIDVREVSLTYIKKAKIAVNYQYGDINGNFDTLAVELGDVTIGYPFASAKSGLAFLTIGSLNYSKYSKMYAVPKYEVNVGMLGFDFILTPNESVNFEVYLQHSILGGQRFNGNVDSSANLTDFKFKVRFILADNLGLVTNYRLMTVKSTDPLINPGNVSISSMGLVYRF